MVLNGRVMMALVMLGIFASMVLIAGTFPEKARLLPWVIGIPGTILCILQLGFDLAAARKGEPLPKDAHEGAADDEAPAEGRVRRELTLLGYFVGLVAVILLIGFWLAAPLFLIAFLRFHEGESWRFTLALTAGGWLALYLIFDKILGILLHEGFLLGAIL